MLLINDEYGRHQASEFERRSASKHDLIGCRAAGSRACASNTQCDANTQPQVTGSRPQKHVPVPHKCKCAVLYLCAELLAFMVTGKGMLELIEPGVGETCERARRIYTINTHQVKGSQTRRKRSMPKQYLCGSAPL